MIPTVGDLETRRQMLLAAPGYNGIDYIEVVPGNRPVLKVFFLKELPDPTPDLIAAPAERIRITGGARIRQFTVLAVRKDESGALAILLDRPGDLSTYTLRLIAGNLDPVLGQAPFIFRPGCQSPVDPQARPAPAPVYTEPLIDYLARDYQSMRTALLDFVRSRAPGWDDSPADLGTTLLELMAYAGDQLTYYQDAVMNEAWLETARQRESVRRHALLLDYRMHDGCAARSFLHVQVKPALLPGFPEGGVVGAGTLVTTRAGGTEAPVTFAVIADTPVHVSANQFLLHHWGSTPARLPRGATQFDLQGEQPVTAGQYLLLEEVLSPVTGREEESAPSHRQVVRVEAVTALVDPLSGPVTRITVPEADALTHDFVITAFTGDGRSIDQVTVVRGNMVPVEHGQPVQQSFAAIAPEPGRTFRVKLAEGPVTCRAPLPAGQPAAHFLAPAAPTAQPRIALSVVPPLGPARPWQQIPDLLGASPFDESFVAETDNAGRASLRFGDGVYGKRPLPGSTLQVTYWVGNGEAGNVGAETLTELGPPGYDTDGEPLPWPFGIVQVRNPLPARGGVEPEPLEQVKRLAPAAISRQQFRAVTAADYAAAAETLPEVARAVATFRWTGSWHTVHLTIDPRSRMELTEPLRRSVIKAVSHLQLAGYDLEVTGPTYVPLELALEVQAAPGHRRIDVQEAVLEALSSTSLPDGRQGFFHPDRFTFAEPVYLSHIYAAVEAVPGVASVRVLTFRRLGQTRDGDELARGLLAIGATEIARLDNDPNYPENGLLHLTMRGGL